MNIVVYGKRGEKQILPYRGEESLLRLFALHGISLPARCGGMGTCKKCKVKLLSGSLVGGETGEKDVYFACRAKPTSDAEILVDLERGSGLEVSSLHRLVKAEGEGLGIAVDLGTTTVAASLIDLKSGAVLATASTLNPQAVFGSDVLSRILACGKEENLKALTGCVRKAIAELAGRLLAGRGEEARSMAVAGNTTMLHLLCGVDPSSIGVAPFTPVFTRMREARGGEFGFPAEKVFLLPSVSAYVGADITAGMLAADFLGEGDNVLLVDLGTNGEMAFKHGGKILCTSTAAGPALEGACIECGVGGIGGAVNRVWERGGKLEFSTIDGAPPVGICGAGLVDLISVLLQRGEIDGSGYLNGEKYFLCDNVYLTRADVRQFQLAKAAVSAGISALLRRAGVREGEVEKCLIAGGLGSYMSVASEVKTGLLPAALGNIAEAVGNGSLYGAQLFLLDDRLREEAVCIAERAETVDLASDPYFAEEFIGRMCFDEP